MRSVILLCALLACGLAATFTRDTERIDLDTNVVVTNSGTEKREMEEEFKVTITDKNRKKRKSAKCTSEFEKLGENSRHKNKDAHTYCNENYSADETGSVSESDINLIVNRHNELRRDPKTTRTAKAMCKMYWDPELAEIAQYFAETCPSGHDKLRDVPGYDIQVGQNLAWGSSLTWAGAIQAWFDEVKDFKYGQGSTNGNAVGHYTQVVKDTACRIGCGFADCPDKPGTNKDLRTFVCNYATGQENFRTPFVTGTPCSGCPNKCEKNLCDNQGKMCYNGGTLNPNTGTCECTELYKGDSCQTPKCNGGQKGYCGTPQPYGYTADLCHASNVPIDCPIMCGICKADRSPGNKFIPAPATQLIAGDDKPTNIGDGNNNGGNSDKPTNTGDGNNNGGNSGCTDHDYCVNWNVGLCEYNVTGHNKKVKDFCPRMCEICT